MKQKSLALTFVIILVATLLTACSSDTPTSFPSPVAATATVANTSTATVPTNTPAPTITPTAIPQNNSLKLRLSTPPVSSNNGGVSLAIFSPDNKKIASAGFDKTVRLWDISTGKELLNLKGHYDRIDFITFSLDGKLLASVSFDGVIKVWDLDNAKELISFQPGNYAAKGLVFSPDAKTLIISNEDKTIKYWDVAANKEIKSMNSPDPASDNFTVFYNSVAKSFWGVTQIRTVWSQSSPKNPQFAYTFKFWNLADLKQVQTLNVGLSNATALSLDGKTLVSGYDGSVKLWDINSGKQLKAFNVGTTVGYVSELALSPDAKTVAIINDKGVSLWDSNSGKLLQDIVQSGYYAYRPMFFSPDNKFLVGIDGACAISVWEVATGKISQTVKCSFSDILATAISHDNKVMAAANRAAVKLLDTTTGKELLTITPEKDQIFSTSSLAFSPDGKILARADAFRKIDLWNVTTGQKISDLEDFKVEDKGIGAIAFSADGKTLTVSYAPGFYAIWDVASGKVLSQGSGGGNNAAFSVDGKIFIARTWSANSFVIKDISTGKDLIAGASSNNTKESLGIKDPNSISVVTLNANGTMAASATVDTKIKIWDVATGKEVLTFKAHDYFINALAFTSDGKRLISASKDNTIKIWDVASGNQLFTTTPQQSFGVNTLTIANDGKFAIAGHLDGSVKIWDLIA